MRLVLLLLAVLLVAAAPAVAAGPYTEAQRLAAVRCDGVPGAAGSPVLLIPGTGVTAEQNWSWGYARTLRDAGHGVCTVDPPERSTVDVQDSVLFVRTAIEEVARRSGRRMAVIGHSQGAFHAVHVLRLFPELAPLVDDVVGLAGLYVRGSDAIRGDCATPCSAAFWQVATGSHYMDALARRSLPAGPSYTAIGTLVDTVVTPQPAVNALPGGRSIQLQDVCPGRRFVDGTDHIYLAADAVAHALTVDALDHPGTADPARIPKATCLLQIYPGADLVKLATLGPSLLGALAGQDSATKVAAEPPLRCPLAPGCDVAARPPRARLVRGTTVRGGRFALRVTTPASGRVRLRFAGRAVRVGPSVRVGAGRSVVRPPARVCARGRCRALGRGTYRATVELRRGTGAWEPLLPVRLRVR